MKKKYKVLIGISICMLVIIALFFYLLYANKKTSNKENSNEKTMYECDYYSVSVPSNWKRVQVDDTQINYETEGIIVADIQTGTEFLFEKTTSSIMENFLGMHVYAKGDSVDTDFGTYTMKKILVGVERTIPEKENRDDPYSDELHYFYFAKDTGFYLSLTIRTDKVNEKEADEIANSVKIKDEYLR